jgi:hypothetical protein
MQALLYFPNAATALTILSAPTSFGLSILMEIPVFTPGPTTSGVMAKYRKHRSTIVGVRGGTTEETMIALTSREERWLPS